MIIRIHIYVIRASICTIAVLWVKNFFFEESKKEGSAEKYIPGDTHAAIAVHRGKVKNSRWDFSIARLEWDDLCYENIYQRPTKFTCHLYTIYIYIYGIHITHTPFTENVCECKMYIIYRRHRRRRSFRILHNLNSCIHIYYICHGFLRQR